MLDFTQSTIVKAADLIHLTARPLPNSPDGYYDYEALAIGERVGNEQLSTLHNAINAIQSQAKKGLPISNPKDIVSFAKFIENKDNFDDRTLLFNHTLSAISKLPPGNLVDTLNNEVVTVLYDTIPHPPATLLGSQYRTADGSNNSLQFPSVGQAGTSYARSVQGRHPQPLNNLPDPGLIFDTLLKARDFLEHPGKNSSLTFAFASLVTHSLFWTDQEDWTKNKTSSYLDLSPLYGTNQAEQDRVRDKNLGLGLLYRDTFSDSRLGFQPPAVSALLCIFNRNHNYIASMLIKINERKRWVSPPPTNEAERLAQDEEIFQTARLINCGHFIAIIFGDYVAGFLGLSRDGNSWAMNPFDPITKLNGNPVPRGQGNHVSVEFNLLYRWHATVAEKDIKWTEETLRKAFKGKPFDKLTIPDFKSAAVDVFRSLEPDPKRRTFAGLKRRADGSFADDDLAKLLHDATEATAGAYRARGTPECLRVVEILTMQQARSWGVCTMNEFRKFLGLRQFMSFEEWNPDPVIAEAARKLYHHIDNLELYAGLQAEATIPLGPGSGICCGYTMTRAILGDAISLVRGDRFYTTDYTPENLTSWGYQDCARDPNNGAFGAALPKLLLRHLPRHYPANNVYGLFPFFTPGVTKQNLTNLGVAAQYQFLRPVATPIPKILNTLTGIRHVFADSAKFKVTYGSDMRLLTEDYGFLLVFDEEKTHAADKANLMHALWPDQETVAQHIEWYKQKTAELIKEKSFTYDGVPGKHVDVVKNVINLVSVHWAADKLCGIPLKTKANPKGIFTEQEVSDMLSLLVCVFQNIQPEHGWFLRRNALAVSKIINGLIQQTLNEVAPRTASNIFAGLFATVGQKVWPSVAKESHPFLRRLAASGRPRRELVANVMGLAVGSSVNYSQAAAQVVEFYLDDKYSQERTHIVQLSRQSDAASAESLRGYVREAMRLDPQYGGLFRTVAEDDVVPQGDGFSPLKVTKGDLLFASYKNAHLNPADFPNPTIIDPTRPRSSYQLQGAGFHLCPGVSFAEQTISEIVKIIFALPNLRRAQGPAGVLASYSNKVLDTDNKLYVTSTGFSSPWPGSLTVVYDPPMSN